MKKTACLFMAVMIILIASVAAYFIGSMLSGGILAEAGEAGARVMEQPDWMYYYSWLVLFMGGAAGAVLILWTVLSHWVLSAAGSKRMIWLVFFIISAVLCVAVPIIFEKTYSSFTNDVSIEILFFVCYSLFGYWGGSILVTSEKHRLAPPLAGLVR